MSPEQTEYRFRQTERDQCRNIVCFLYVKLVNIPVNPIIASPPFATARNVFSQNSCLLSLRIRIAPQAQPTAAINANKLSACTLTYQSHNVTDTKQQVTNTHSDVTESNTWRIIHYHLDTNRGTEDKCDGSHSYRDNS